MVSWAGQACSWFEGLLTLGSGDPELGTGSQGRPRWQEGARDRKMSPCQGIDTSLGVGIEGKAQTGGCAGPRR